MRSGPADASPPGFASAFGTEPLNAPALPTRAKRLKSRGAERAELDSSRLPTISAPYRVSATRRLRRGAALARSLKAEWPKGSTAHDSCRTPQAPPLNPEPPDPRPSIRGPQPLSGRCPESGNEESATRKQKSENRKRKKRNRFKTGRPYCSAVFWANITTFPPGSRTPTSRMP